MHPKESLAQSQFKLERILHPGDLYSNMRTCPELRSIPDNKFPENVAIIPDGNRRFARRQNIPIEIGHQQGADNVVDKLRAFADLPIKGVTVWGFSTDNWNRDEREIDAIMHILDRTAHDILPELMERNGRLIHLGRWDRIPTHLADTLKNAVQKTKLNKGQIVALAIDFGGHDQVDRMLAAKVINPDLTQEQLRDGGGDVKPADLLIRTGEDDGGLVHTSDIGWLVGKPTLIATHTKSFPALTRQDIAQDLRQFALTQRRLGK